MPTLCIMNGLTIAGGLLFALMFDFRAIYNDDKNFVCLSEINIGISLTPALGAMVKYQLDPQTARLLSYGGRYNAKSSLSMRVVDYLYSDYKELDKLLLSFAKEYAPKGQHRLALKDLKENLHHETHQKLLHGGLTHLELMNAKPFDVNILKGKL